MTTPNPAAPNQPPPKGIRAPLGASSIGITWRDGLTQNIPNAVLRGYCPCAGCQGHSGPVTFQPGRDSELVELESVGNYGLKLTWGDHHNTGIYTFSFLRKLGDLYATHGDQLPTELPELGR